MWLAFFFYAAIIILAGTQLTKNAEVISSNFGLSRAWAGALLLPLATSLPELVTCQRAVLIDAPDLAGGNIYGSILFNLSLIALIDLVQGKGPLTSKSKRGLILTALFSIAVLNISILGISGSFPLTLGWIGIDTFIILLAYLLGSGLLMKLEGKKGTPDRKGNISLEHERRKTLFRSLLFFLLAAAAIIYAGINLTDTADLIAVETGLSRTLVGSLFIAIATSLPELVTTMTAVRLGFVEMAVGNVFGANFFNIFLFFISDLFYRQGPLLSNLAPSNMFAALMAILLTVIALVSLVYPFRGHLFRMGSPSLLIISGYIFTLIILFFIS